MAKRLKQQYLRLADNQELLQGVQGEIITADVLKPYIDALATKTNAQDIQTAVTALENKILGGVDMDGDTLSELYAKITTLKNLTDADKTGLVALISAKADESSVAFRLSAKADETSVQNRLDAKADEASVVTRLDAKANEASVQTRLDAKANEASVQTRLDAKANEASVQTRLDAKASIEQLVNVESIAVNAVTNEFLELALATKITSAQAEVIAQGITNALETKIMGGVGTDADTFAELKGLLDNLQNLSEADVNGVMTAVSEKIAKSDIYNAVEYPQGFDSSTIGATLASFVTAVNVSSEKVVSSSLLSLLLKDLMAGVAQSWQAQGQVNDGFGQSIATKLDKADFEQVLQVLTEEQPYANPNGTSINANVISQKKIAFNNDIAIKKAVIGDMQLDSMVGVGFDANGNPINQKQVDHVQMGADLPDEGGDGFLQIMIVEAEEGFVKRMSPMQLMTLIAMNPNSPVNQMITDLTARVAELEGMFENV